MMTARLLYRSHLFIAGVILLTLGLGNYTAARLKVERYQTLMAKVVPQVPAASSLLLREDSSPFPSEAQERWEIVRAKLDFYHVVLSTGRLLMSIGMICTALALIRLRRRRIYAYHSSR